jgi:exo-1,4-beta-D-glucosaminidase
LQDKEVKQTLKDNWFIINSDNISQNIKTLSKPGYISDGWYATSVPNTVLAALVENKIYDDPYFGLNLLDVPGCKKRRNTVFSMQPKPNYSPFRKPWLYRTEFTIDDSLKGQRIWLEFRGINYSANIWVNGEKIAGSDTVRGTFRLYDFDITDFVLFGKKNALVLEVYSPGPRDLALTFIDWAPGMPDDNMGIWQPVILYSSGPAAIKNIFAHTSMDTCVPDEAEISVEADIVNTLNHTIKAEIECTIENIRFGKKITVDPFSTNDFILTHHEFPQLKIKNPRIWWPYQLGKPELYKLKMVLNLNGMVSDSKEITFGIRQIKAVINNRHGALLFLINGKELLIRGAAWTPDLMLRQSKERDKIDTDFLINLNMNAIRMEGKLATDNFWDICDEKGILVFAGWPCCNHFEKWDRWKNDDIDIARKSMRSQILRLRNHPSLAAWFYGSDFPPPESVERVYLKVLKETYNSLPKISSASHKKSRITGITGVKMTGPYSYVPPVYWYDCSMPGYAERFNTETSPDVCIPIIESIEKMIPENQMRVGSKAWNYHTGVGKQFNNTKKTDRAVLKRYGRLKGLKDYVKTVQILGYECWRSMYEAHNRNFPRATGVIGWMLNSPWPSLIWQLYDYYLNPTGAFFGAKKACEPLHIQYSYDDHSIWVINNKQVDYQGLNASIKIYDFGLKERLSRDIVVDIKERSRKEIFTLPFTADLSKVYFLRLAVEDQGLIESRQLYWLPTSSDIFTGKHFWYHSPVKTHADMHLIRKMPGTDLKESLGIVKIKNTFYATANIKNSGDYLAFFIWTKLYNKKTGKIIAPVFWSDNCISLFPSESAQIQATIPEDLTEGDITIRTEGWNCQCSKNS